MFLLFAGSNYYPDGGWSDFIKSFSSEEEAKNFVSDESMKNHDWYQIVDSAREKMVDEGHVNIP